MNHPKTKTGLAFLSGVLVVLGVSIAILWETPKTQTIMIEVTGTEGRTVEARIHVDGNEQTFQGTIPVEFTIDAHRLSWEVRRLDGPEKESFKVAVHTLGQRNWGGYAEGDEVLHGGLISPTGLRRSRAWHGRFEE